MKKVFFTIVAGFAITAAQAQTTSSASTTMNQSAQRIMQLRANERMLLLGREKPNEIKFGRTSADGILVQLGKGANPLQMVNPFAPEEYGSPADNVVEYRPYNMPLGWKFFSFSF